MGFELRLEGCGRPGVKGQDSSGSGQLESSQGEGRTQYELCPWVAEPWKEGCWPGAGRARALSGVVAPLVRGSDQSPVTWGEDSALARLHLPEGDHARCWLLSAGPSASWAVCPEGLAGTPSNPPALGGGSTRAL